MSDPTAEITAWNKWCQEQAKKRRKKPFIGPDTTPWTGDYRELRCEKHVCPGKTYKMPEQKKSIKDMYRDEEIGTDIDPENPLYTGGEK